MPWNFLSDENDKSVFCFVNKVTFRKRYAWGLVVGGTKPIIRGLELSDLPIAFKEGRRVRGQ